MLKEIRKVGSKNQVAILWDDLSEPAKAAASIKSEGRRQRAVKLAEGKGSGHEPQSWFGAPSFEEFTKRLKTGWPEGVERLSKLAVKELTAVSVRRRRFRSDQGDEVDMQAIWRGDLSRAWTRTRRQARVGVRTISIICNLTANWSTTSDELFWRGASALRLADALTEAGYNVGIYAAETGSNAAESKGADIGQFLEIKAPDRPLDLSALAAITCMPGYFRSSLFAGIVYGCDAIDADASSGLGRTNHSLTEPFAAMLGITGCVVQPEVNSQQAAEEWIAKAIEQVEGPMQLAA